MKEKIDVDVIDSITMLMQVILGIYIITFGVASLYVNELFLICEILVSLTLFVIAYNNHKVYKRKYMTFVYLGLGIVIIAASVFI